MYGERVDARPGMKKDRADAVAGAVHGVLKEKGVLTRMGSVGNLNTLFSSPHTVVDADPASNSKKNPVLENLNNPQNGFKRDEIASRIVSSSKDTCDSCQRVGGIEFEDGFGSRCFEATQAVYMACIICGVKKKRMKHSSNSKSKWVTVRESDEFLMQQLAGYSG